MDTEVTFWKKFLSFIGWTDFVEDRRWRKNPSPSPSDRRDRLFGSDGGGVSQTVQEYGFSIYIYRLETPEPARDIADQLKMGSIVIVDFSCLTDSRAKEVLDFVSGVAYGLGGTITKIDKRVYMFSPKGTIVRDMRIIRKRDEEG